ncbi:MAG: TolB family protein, partial [Planctomycetota bacterium]
MGKGTWVVSPAIVRKPLPKEAHFGTLVQLTFGGENAEAYWSFDETRLIFQSTRDGLEADQIFIMDDTGRRVRMVSTGKGRCTCSYFLPGDERILFASTHASGDAPPQKPPFDPRLGYVWPIFNSYAIYTAKPDGSDLQEIADSNGYDAEATVSPTGHRIVFTSTRDGD